MKVILDTNAYIDFCRGDSVIKAIFSRSSELFLPYIVLAELRVGFRHSRHSHENESVLQRFLSRPRITTLYPNNDTTHHYASLFLQLYKQGTPIPTNDIWIAALAVQYNAVLCTRDTHFDHLPQIWTSG